LAAVPAATQASTLPVVSPVHRRVETGVRATCEWGRL